MKAYVKTTGVLFGLLTLAHIWRVVIETHLIADPWFVSFTVIAAALSAWAWRVVMRAKEGS